MSKKELPLFIINDDGGYQRDQELKRHYILTGIESEYIHKSQLYKLKIERQDPEKRNLSLIFENEEEGLAPMILVAELQEDEYLELEEMDEILYNVTIKSFGEYAKYQEEYFPMIDTNVKSTPSHISLKMSLILNRMGDKIDIIYRKFNSLAEVTSKITLLEYAINNIAEDRGVIFEEHKWHDTKYIMDLETPNECYMFIGINRNAIECIDVKTNTHYNLSIESYILEPNRYIVLDKEDMDIMYNDEGEN